MEAGQALTTLRKAALKSLYYTGGHRLLAPLTQGVGAILMLHQVTATERRNFDPNGPLRISPEFLDQTIRLVRERGFETVSLDEAHRRMVDGDFERPFIVFTLDDGYRDNLEIAYPIFRKHEVPFCIYVPTSYADHEAELWWLTLEQVIRDVDEVSLKMDGSVRRFTTARDPEKVQAFHQIYTWLRRIDEDQARGVVRELSRGLGRTGTELARSLLMGWEELRRIAADPLCTIGAHTVGHYAIAKLSEARARYEMEECLFRLERELGVRPRHFSYPYGSPDAAGPREFRLARELGYRTAVTTHKGVLFAEHSAHLTALPRLSINGDYEDPRFLSVLLSGAPFALLNGFRRVAVAG